MLHYCKLIFAYSSIFLVCSVTRLFCSSESWDAERPTCAQRNVKCTLANVVCCWWCVPADDSFVLADSTLKVPWISSRLLKHGVKTTISRRSMKTSILIPMKNLAEWLVNLRVFLAFSWGWRLPRSSSLGLRGKQLIYGYSILNGRVDVTAEASQSTFLKSNT